MDIHIFHFFCSSLKQCIISDVSARMMHTHIFSLRAFRETPLQILLFLEEEKMKNKTAVYFIWSASLSLQLQLQAIYLLLGRASIYECIFKYRLLRRNSVFFWSDLSVVCPLYLLGVVNFVSPISNTNTISLTSPPWSTDSFLSLFKEDSWTSNRHRLDRKHLTITVGSLEQTNWNSSNNVFQF